LLVARPDVRTLGFQLKELAMRGLFLGHFNNDGCCARHDFIIAVQHIWRRDGSLEFLRHHADACLRLWRWLLSWPDRRPVIRIASLADAKQALFATGTVLPRCQTQCGRHLAAVGKLLCVANRSHDRRGNDGPTPRSCCSRLATGSISTTLEWVAWFNHHRLLEPIGYIPPAEAEANYYQQLTLQAATV
jgi:hypothetical protein